MGARDGCQTGKSATSGPAILTSLADFWLAFVQHILLLVEAQLALPSTSQLVSLLPQPFSRHRPGPRSFWGLWHAASASRAERAGHLCNPRLGIDAGTCASRQAPAPLHRNQAAASPSRGSR